MKFVRFYEVKEAGERERQAFDCEFKFVGGEAAPGSLEGYGAVFDQIDLGGDIIAPGAFAKTLADWNKRKALPPMLWQHNTDEPIGVWTSMSEDSTGLKVAGELLIDDVPQAKIARALAAKGVVRGLSIGYRTRDSDIMKTGARLIKAADLYELSMVTIPMQPAAGLTSIKNDALFPNDRDLEQGYRDGGLSQREAKIAVAVTKKMVLRDGVRTEPAHREGAADALMTIRKAAALFSN